MLLPTNFGPEQDQMLLLGRKTAIKKVASFILFYDLDQ